MRASLGVLAFFSFVTSGCLATKDALDPGTPLGTFEVAAKVASNSCGEGALGEQDAWKFSVVLSRGPGAIYWNNGQEVITGKVAGDGRSFSFESGVTITMSGSSNGAPACSVSRTDTASGELDATSDDVASFEGSLGYSFVPTSGSDCSALDGVVVAGLPCSMTYSIDATRTVAPKND